MHFKLHFISTPLLLSSLLRLSQQQSRVACGCMQHGTSSPKLKCKIAKKRLKINYGLGVALPLSDFVIFLILWYCELTWHINYRIFITPIWQPNPVDPKSIIKREGKGAPRIWQYLFNNPAKAGPKLLVAAVVGWNSTNVCHVLN